MTIKDPQFIITPEILDKCTQFAQSSVMTSTSKYAQRRQFNVEKIAKDITVGKIGEEYLWQKLRETYPNLSLPDYNVYEKKDKNWSPDLSDPSVPISLACKSQDYASAAAYGESWVFQMEDKGIFRDKSDHHFVCFVKINVPKMVGELRSIVRVSWLHENGLFQPMKLKHLTSKVAVYYCDLIRYDNIWQI